MAKKKELGRPRIEIDFKRFEEFCVVQSTLEEIAGWFDCSPDTIERRVAEHYLDDEGNGRTFADVSEGLRGKGKTSLRRAQFQRALKGSDRMLIHLGKQYCGQTDVVEHTGRQTWIVKYAEPDEEDG